MLSRIVRNSARAAARRPISQSFARYSDKKEEQKSNLLNDDLLEKAGMETEGSKKKWEGTARKQQDESELMKKRTKRSFFFSSLFLLAVGGFALYQTRPFDDDEKRRWRNVNSEDMDAGSLWQRMASRVKGSFEYFSEPAFEKLLPDPPAPPMARPYTLVLALEGLLVEPKWSREHGWRVAKRPGVDYFLGYLAQYYEIVVFSDKYMMNDQETVLKLDPMGVAISYPLFREASRYQDGHIIKDLSYLNRDLSKVICIDVDPEAVSLQPENALIVPRWRGNKNDTDLIRLLPLLEYIGAQPIKDVRPLLRNLKQSGNPIDEFERRDALAREAWAAKQGQGSWVGSLVNGGKRDPNMMPQDYIRREGQKNYANFQKYIEEHGKKEVEKAKQREEAAMEKHKVTMWQLLTRGAPSPEDIQATMQELEKEATEEAQVHLDAQKAAN